MGWGEPRGPHVPHGGFEAQARARMVHPPVDHRGDPVAVWALLLGVAALLVAALAILVATARTAATAVELAADGLAVFTVAAGGGLAAVFTVAALVVVRRAVR